MRPPAARFAALTLICAGALTRDALAAPDTQTAEALFQSGKEAMARGDLATACPRFAESVRLDPAVGSFLNLADCEERAGALASALAHVQTARDRLREGDYRIAYANERIAKLTARVPRLTVIVRPATEGASVVRDETPLGEGSLGVALPVDPGPHTVRLRAPGRADAQVALTLRESESRTIEIAPGAPLAKSDDALADRADRADRPITEAAGATERGRTQRAVGVAFGGAGLAILAIGTVVGLVSKSTYNAARAHCPSGPASCDADGVSGGETAYTEASVATIAYIVGGTFLASGLTLYWTSPHGITITPVAGAHRAGVDAVMRW